MKVITSFKNGKVDHFSLDSLKKMHDAIDILTKNGFGSGDSPAAAGTPTAGTMNEPAKPPIKNTGGLTREDLAKPKELARRRKMLQERNKKLKQVSEGKIGTSDPKFKNDKIVKPSGHALGG